MMRMTLCRAFAGAQPVRAVFFAQSYHVPHAAGKIAALFYYRAPRRPHGRVPPYYTEYRYILGTRGENPLICIGINPSTAQPGDLILTVGAGNVYKIGEHLLADDYET